MKPYMFCKQLIKTISLFENRKEIKACYSIKFDPKDNFTKCFSHTYEIELNLLGPIN